MKLGRRPQFIGLLLHTAIVNGFSKEEFEENTSRGLRLLSLSSNEEPVWKTNEEKWGLLEAHVHFFDITDSYNPDEEENGFNPRTQASSIVAAYPDGPIHQTDVKTIVNSLSIDNLQMYLSNLTSFNNRFYLSDTGTHASQWIFDTVSNIVTLNPSVNASISSFTHNFPQSSIIATIPGRISTNPVVILGAHLDSINLQVIGQDEAPPESEANPPPEPTSVTSPQPSQSPESGSQQDTLKLLMNAPAPGADDDGSGVVALIETFRALIVAGFKPTSTVEFHWYAGEEAGLLGSQDIANQYSKSGRSVKAMMQLDMTAYVKPGTQPLVAFIPDFVDSSLNVFLSTLVDEYLNIGWVTSSPCGYACSDHASWTSLGYSSAFPFEASFNLSNQYLHTPNDTTNLSGFSFEHVLEYAKLGVAYAVELGAEPGGGINGGQNAAIRTDVGLNFLHVLAMGATLLVWTIVL